jgi:hypothetical protein
LADPLERFVSWSPMISNVLFDRFGFREIKHSGMNRID